MATGLHPKRLFTDEAAYIAGLIDGEGTITRKKTVSSRHTPSHCFAVTSRQALSLLEQVTPYLRSYKRSRADLALAQYTALTPRNGVCTPEQLARRGEFESRLLSMRTRRNSAAS